MLRSTILTTAILAGNLAHAEPVEWTLDLGHAHIGWEIDHMNMANTVGRFNAFDGTFMIDEDDPANSKITFTINAASVDSNHVGRDNHIRNADYLNVDAYPEISFTSTAVQMLTPTTGKLIGDLDLHGVTAPVTLDFEMVNRRNYPEFIPNYDQIEVVGFHVTGEVLRLDHGMDFIAFLGSPTGFAVTLDARFDLVQCDGVPDTNVPCHWGRVDGFKGPNE
ncbi:YceI family protein [Actibacterium ureilyticum]|uniref:YceI family protein n=1 Tax=Actibacterium ureilyticum TaxID=1590614 RepID=UPI000BAAA5E0|nr:YceI family protein [Actibacterium ureilyticum]